MKIEVKDVNFEGQLLLSYGVPVEEKGITVEYRGNVAELIRHGNEFYIRLSGYECRQYEDGTYEYPSIEL